jgi:hypothetical protein
VFRCRRSTPKSNFGTPDIQVRLESLHIEKHKKLPILREEATLLLKEISKDSQGNLMYIIIDGGCIIQTNGKNFSTSNEPREIAKWEQAIQELLNTKLITAKSNELFTISALGYEVADNLP